jgi:transcriptional regulator
MYIPPYYQETDEGKLLAFMQAHSFAVLASAQNNNVRATHLPFIVEKRDSKIYLVSHLAKANPQWAEFGNELLIVFQGPHGYVSPSHYEKEQNVPTWNYIAVHAYGKASIIEEPAEAIQVLEKTILNYEAGYFEQWKGLSDVYKSNMIKGIVAFEIEVLKLEGKYKLSQNKTGNERKAIANTFAKSGDTAQEELANEMKRRG